MHLYLATGLESRRTATTAWRPTRTSGWSSSRFTIDEALAMVDAGEIVDAKSILGILWLDRLRRAGELG